MDSFSEGSDSGGSHRGREGGSAKSGRKKRRKDRERDRADGSGYGEAGQAQTQQGMCVVAFADIRTLDFQGVNVD